tara:strand:+ start:1088 stop:2149 length:1062 start_codon:yes stop_codon:yes gene_type:complete
MGDFVKSAAGFVGNALGGPVGGALATGAMGLLGGMGGEAQRQQVGTSQTQVGLPEYIKPSYERGVSEAERIYGEGGFGAYQQLSPFEREQIQRGMALSAAPSPFYDPATQATQQLLSGGSSFLSPAMQAYQQLGEQPSAVSQLSGLAEGLLAPTREKIISQFERGGRSGSGAFGEALARGETTALAPFLQAALAEDNRRKQAAAAGLADIGRLGIGATGTGIEAAPVIEALPYAQIGRGLELGGALSAQDFAAQQAEAQALSQYVDIIRNLTQGSTTISPREGDVGEPSTGNKLLSSTVGPLIEKGIGSLGGFLTGYGAPSSVSSPISAISTPDTGYRVPQMSTFLSDIGLGN